MTRAVQCPVCKKVFTEHGIWHHVIGVAKREAFLDDKEDMKHFSFMKKDVKKYKVITVKYDYPFKVIAPSFYDWRRKSRKN